MKIIYQFSKNYCRLFILTCLIALPIGIHKSKQVIFYKMGWVGGSYDGTFHEYTPMMTLGISYYFILAIYRYFSKTASIEMKESSVKFRNFYGWTKTVAWSKIVSLSVEKYDDKDTRYIVLIYEGEDDYKFPLTQVECDPTNLLVKMKECHQSFLNSSLHKPSITKTD